MLSKNLIKTIVGLIIVIVSMANTGQNTYSEAANVYWNGQELETEMDYLAEHMKAEDKE
jgi:hypothetical protein